MTQVRGRIVAHLRAHPGTHVSGLVRELDLAPGQVQYHLGTLQDTDQIVAERFRGRTHYFPSEYSPAQRRSIAVLRRETARDILTHLLEHGSQRPAAVTRTVGIARGTLEYHLEALLEEDLVEKHRRPSGAVTLAVPDPEMALERLGAATPSTTDRFVDRFTRLVDSLLESDPG